MGIEDVLDRIRETVKGIVPKTIEIINIEFEGPLLIIYTKQIEEFAENSDIVRQLAQTLRKRIAIRPDPSILMDIDEAKAEIEKIIPDEAGLTDVFFDVDAGEATIEAMAPGLAIGKYGVILNDIKKHIGWAPRVVRTPPIPSKTVKDIRRYMRSKTLAKDRKALLRKIGRKIHREIGENENWVRITALGGFREVGRSSSLLTTRNSKILVDCGINVGNENFPYINLPEVLPLESIDAVVVTHAHLDHCGLVPLLYKYGYDGPVYCTLPTRDLMSLLQLDYLKVATADGKKIPYESLYIRETVKHCIPLRYGDTTDISPDVRLTLHNAGHILGSSIAHFHIGDGLHNVAFTGDIKYEKTWLFNPAMNKFPRIETLVMESTYGGYQDFQPSRIEASDQLKDIVQRTLSKKGNVVIPVFAVGRSQEVMIVLERLIRSGEIPETPIYLDGMIWEATAIHTAYPEYLNTYLRNMIFQKNENPFLSEVFNRVDSSEMRKKILSDPEPCIVLATAGMLNGGPVMEYIKAWVSDQKNTLVFVGYQAEGTLGRRLQNGLEELQFSEKGKTIAVSVKMNMETVDGFSGHSDRRQLLNYIYHMEPRVERVITVHGENLKCIDLASTLHKKYGLETKAPLNLETIRLR
ncbi:MAG: beta-CASP ribonuclease aCPSF1 [Thermoplasmatales archaeon]|nr:beta-CASP ribonuclease aCPSF1 [Thermoplasmatales archaeon]